MTVSSSTSVFSVSLSEESRSPRRADSASRKRTCPLGRPCGEARGCASCMGDVATLLCTAIRRPSSCSAQQWKSHSSGGGRGGAGGAGDCGAARHSEVCTCTPPGVCSREPGPRESRARAGPGSSWLTTVMCGGGGCGRSSDVWITSEGRRSGLTWREGERAAGDAAGR